MRRFLCLCLLTTAAFACNETEPAEAPAAAPAAADADAAAADPHAAAGHDAEEQADAGPPRGIKAEWTDFGGPWALTETVPVATVLDAPADYTDKVVRVSGEVTDVCQAKGCWMVMADGNRSIRVTMKDHGFGVYADGAGGDCEVEGTIVAKPLDPNRVAHFESESANPDAMPEKQAQGDMVYELVATSVRMKKGEG